MTKKRGNMLYVEQENWEGDVPYVLYIMPNLLWDLSMINFVCWFKITQEMLGRG